jgi:hypothetical protein
MAETGNPFAPDRSEAILREIRDELRTSHQTAGTAASPSGRPSPGFIATQQTVDRMVAGQWATMGWANAYQSSIKTSLANDLMGTMGLRAAPQTMWQREYEQMSSAMLGDRITSFPADLIMPGFGRRSRDMGAQIYQLSSRFNRAGDNLDTNVHASMNLGRELQLGAARDLRLSGADYGSILQTSAQAGQFDFAGGIGDVKSQFNELKSAVADLTKTMRLSAGEVSQTLGAFRQFGIVDVADQKRMAERLSATARTAGISTPEMAGMARAGAEFGLQFGLGAEGSMALSQNLAMAARGASRTGLISGNIMSAAGGVQGMVQAQQAAIQQFAGSAAGYYTALGAGAGATGGSLEDMLAGIGATGGTMGGIVAAESRRMDFMERMSGGQRQRLFNRNISQQMGMIGIDPNSAEATDYAFTMVRGQMGDAAGLAYARQNFSAEGRKQRWQDAYRTELSVENQKAQRDYQLKMENETMLGSLRQATGELGAGVAGMGMWAGRGVSSAFRQVGTFMGMNTSTFGQAAENLGLNGDDALSAEAAAGSIIAASRQGAAGNSREQAVKLTGSVTSASGLLATVGGVGGGLSGVAAGSWAGAKIGGMFGLGLGAPGAAIGMIAGGVIGAGLGYIGAKGVGGWAGQTELKGDEATNYLSALRGASGGISQRAVNIASGKSAEALSSLSSNQSFQKLLKNFTNGGKLSDADSREVAKLAAAAGSATGVSAEDVMGVARSMGVDVQMQDSYNSAASGAKRYEQTMADVMDGIESSKLSIASGEVAAGVQSYAKATTDVERNKARAQLSAAGINGRGMDNLITAIDEMDGGARNKLVSDASDYVTRRGDTAINKRMGAFNSLARNLASEAGAMNQAGGREAYERIQELEKDPRALLELMTGGGDAKDAALRDFLIRQDDTGMMRNLKELGGMDDLMQAGNDEQFQKVTGLSGETLQKLRTTFEGDSKLSPTQKSAMMKQAAASMMISTSAAVKQASDPVNIAANNMLLAANILREIQGKISGDTSTKGGKK